MGGHYHLKKIRHSISESGSQHIQENSLQSTSGWAMWSRAKWLGNVVGPSGWAMWLGQVVGQCGQAKWLGHVVRPCGQAKWLGNVVGQCVWAKWLTTKENIR